MAPLISFDSSGNVISPEEQSLTKYGIKPGSSATPGYGSVLSTSPSGQLSSSGIVAGNFSAPMSVPFSPAPAPAPTNFSPAPQPAQKSISYAPTSSVAPKPAAKPAPVAPKPTTSVAPAPLTDAEKGTLIGMGMNTNLTRDQFNAAVAERNKLMQLQNPGSPQNQAFLDKTNNPGGTPDTTIVGDTTTTPKTAEELYRDSLNGGNATTTTPGANTNNGTSYKSTLDTSAQDKQLADINSPQYKQAEYDKMEKEQSAAIEQEYASKEAQLREDAANNKAQRFSELAGLGVNPLSSGATSASNAGDETLNKYITNLHLEKTQALAAMRSQLLGNKNADIDRARKATEDARAMLVQEDATNYTRWHNGLEDVRQATNDAIARAKSNYDLSKSEKDDARKNVDDAFTNYGSDYFKDMSDANKRDLEKSAGMKVGEIDSRIAAEKAKATKEATKQTADDKRKQDDDAIAKGYFPITPDAAKKLTPDMYQQAADGSYYLKPPAEMSSPAGKEYADYVATVTKQGGKPMGWEDYQTADANRKKSIAKAGAGGGTTISGSTDRYNGFLNTLNASKGTDGHVNTDVYKQLRGSLKTEAERGDFDKNFNHLLNPTDPSAAAYAKTVNTNVGHYTSANIPDDIRNELTQNITGLPGKNVNDFISAYPDVDSGYINSLIKQIRGQ